jgi:hypothetical protein
MMKFCKLDISYNFYKFNPRLRGDSFATCFLDQLRIFNSVICQCIRWLPYVYTGFFHEFWPITAWARGAGAGGLRMQTVVGMDVSWPDRAGKTALIQSLFGAGSGGECTAWPEPVRGAFCLLYRGFSGVEGSGLRAAQSDVWQAGPVKIPSFRGLNWLAKAARSWVYTDRNRASANWYLCSVWC